MSCYEQEMLIGQAVKLLCQSEYLPRMELLIIDDASKEGVGIVQHHCKDAADAGFGRVRLLRMDKNVGVSTVRNVGIEEAQGRYLCFHDGDDLWLDGWADGVKKMDEEGLLMLVTGLRVIAGPTLPDPIPPPVPPTVHPMFRFPLGETLPYAQTFLVAKRAKTRFKVSLTRPTRFWPVPTSGEDNFHKIEVAAEGPYDRLGENRIFRTDHWGSEVNPPQWHQPTHAELVVKAFHLLHPDLFLPEVVEAAEEWFAKEGLPADEVIAELEKPYDESLTWWELFCTDADSGD